MQRDVIEELSHALPVPRYRRHAIARELRAHLEETRRELELSGWRPEDAARESMARLGDPREIAQEFVDVYRAPRHRQLGLAFGVAGALLLGAFGAGASFASATSAHHHLAIHAKVSHLGGLTVTVARTTGKRPAVTATR